MYSTLNVFCIVQLVLSLLPCSTAAPASTPTPAPAPVKHLNLTTTAAANGKSTIECWQLVAPEVISSQPGTQGSAVTQLGNLGANASFSIIPGNTNGGLHNAPVPQYVAFLSGAANISVPTSDVVAVVHGGKNGLLFAADTAALSSDGHLTIFTKETALLQIPTADGKVPPHTVLHSGACKGADLTV